MRYIRSVIATLLLMAFFAPSMITMAAPPSIGGCQIFPSDNPWNTDISNTTTYPVHPKSAQYKANIAIHGASKLHPDFGSPAIYGIPYITVTNAQPKVPVTFNYDIGAPDESDPGPYPIPQNAPIEGTNASTGDRHVIVIETDNCVLYELDESHYAGGAQQAWRAYSGAIFNLNSNALRPDGWTSADAAGLPIFPGLARCDEANADAINHALRFTVAHTQSAYVYPATHEASSDTDTNAPPMGLRFRLQAGYPEANITGQSLAIVHALKAYGMILADNGSNWYISGTSDPCWDDTDLNQLKLIPGSAFDAIVSPAPSTVVLPAPSLYSPADAAALNGTPVLDWNTVTSADSYQVLLDQNPNPTTVVTTRQSDQTTQYTPTIPLITGFTYYWRVKATDAATSTTTTSPIFSFSIASPVNAAPTRGYYIDTTPTLTWNMVLWAIKYKIQVSDTANFSHVLVDHLVAAPTLEYTLTNPEALADGVYYWHVAAQDANGNLGGYSPTETLIVNG